MCQRASFQTFLFNRLPGSSTMWASIQPAEWLFDEETKFLPAPREQLSSDTQSGTKELCPSWRNYMIIRMFSWFCTMVVVGSDWSVCDPSALLLYLIPLNHLSCRQPNEYKVQQCNISWDSESGQLQLRVKNWCGRMTPISPHLNFFQCRRKVCHLWRYNVCCMNRRICVRFHGADLSFLMQILHPQSICEYQTQASCEPQKVVYWVWYFLIHGSCSLSEFTTGLPWPSFAVKQKYLNIHGNS